MIKIASVIFALKQFILYHIRLRPFNNFFGLLQNINELLNAVLYLKSHLLVVSLVQKDKNDSFSAHFRITCIKIYS